MVTGLITPLVALAGMYIPDYFPPLPPTLFIMLGASAVSTLSVPPAVLLLASSTNTNAQLVFDAGLAVFPLRVVHLIQPKPIDSDFISDEIFALDTLRTISDSAWQSVVHPLMDSVPIVVVDTRTTSPAIVVEIARMLNPARRRKAVFIVDHDGSRPAMDAVVGPNCQPAVQYVAVDKVALLLRSMTRRTRFQSKAEHEDKRFGFLMTIPNHWSKIPLTNQFMRDGGRLAVRSKHGATLNVSCGAPDSNMPQDRSERNDRILHFLKSSFVKGAVNRSAFIPARDDLNVAGGQVLTPAGSHGIISIVRDGIEYAIQYAIPISAPFSTVEEVNDLVLSFRFVDQPDSPLFRDPEAE